MYLSLLIMNTISFSFMWSNHPISMGLLIITQTMNISLLVGMLSSMFWFSYIIIIIMLSGMLVLFIYMASTASNEKFMTPIKLIYITIMTFIVGLLIQNILQPGYLEFNKMQEINNTETTLLMLMLDNTNIIMLMVVYLFFSMVTISFIVNISEGPLRMKK
uniref:NADH dehydrogenase subunit 6 n=1 Tax=Euscopus rufipes TaxID=1906784 RepID=UPI00110D5752|nr:NADH dehydrogenase subunit 6 [Euscopus rufipes]APO08894.1 NADH dehydrogenase subunit 6 [Euscopus rufipes]